MSELIAIDPGPEESAYCWLRDGKPDEWAKARNDEVRKQLLSFNSQWTPLVIEKVASFGMPVGAEVFETVYWSGRFAEIWRGPLHRITRHEVKMALCHSPRANDGTIRQAIIDRFGGKERAIGKKKTPGPLYGISGDCWSALAVALTYLDTGRQSGGRREMEICVTKL